MLCLATHVCHANHTGPPGGLVAHELPFATNDGNNVGNYPEDYHAIARNKSVVGKVKQSPTLAMFEPNGFQQAPYQLFVYRLA